MTTMTHTATRIIGHPATRAALRCLAGCALTAVQQAIRNNREHAGRADLRR